MPREAQSAICDPLGKGQQFLPLLHNSRHHGPTAQQPTMKRVHSASSETYAFQKRHCVRDMAPAYASSSTRLVSSPHDSKVPQSKAQDTDAAARRLATMPVGAGASGAVGCVAAAASHRPDRHDGHDGHDGRDRHDRRDGRDRRDGSPSSGTLGRRHPDSHAPGPVDRRTPGDLRSSTDSVRTLMTRSSVPDSRDSHLGPEDCRAAPEDCRSVPRHPESSRRAYETIGAGQPTASSVADATTTAAQTLAIAKHYGSRRQQTLQERRASRVLGLRNFNNWAKGEQLRQVLRPGDSVLDLCSGKGGDLFKFAAARIKHLVSVDQAASSIADARRRYESARLRFAATFLVADCHTEAWRDQLPSDLTFDVVSCQFALHYAFGNSRSATSLLRNAAARLRPGGWFIFTIPDADRLATLGSGKATAKGPRDGPAAEATLAPADAESKDRGSAGTVPDTVPGTETGRCFANGLCTIQFPRTASAAATDPDGFGQLYTFSLVDAVDACPEYLVPWPLLRQLVAEAGLDWVSAESFHDLYARRVRPPLPGHRDLGPPVHPPSSSLRPQMTAEEWEVAGLYTAVLCRRPSSPGDMRHGHGHGSGVRGTPETRTTSSARSPSERPATKKENSTAPVAGHSDTPSTQTV